MKFEKASISSREVSCDRCGAVVEREEITSVYFGDKGQKIDYCPRCFKNAK
jgi:late competence protein required for DNA uptake (superfamily II DNA/RNA helicase)